MTKLDTWLLETQLFERLHHAVAVPPEALTREYRRAVLDAALALAATVMLAGRAIEPDGANLDRMVSAAARAMRDAIAGTQAEAN